MRYAEVAVDAPTGVGRLFSYSVPEGMSATAGQLALVPFGSRVLQGIIFELSPAPQVEETRPISEILLPRPVLDETRLKLARWIGEHYVCSLFEAAAPMLPPGSRARSRVELSIPAESEDVESAANSERQLRVLREVERLGTADLERVASNLGEWVRGVVPPLVQRGALTRRYRAARRMVGPRYAESVSANPDARDEIARWMGDKRNRAKRQMALMARLLEYQTPIPAADARREFGSSAVSAVIKRGFARVERERIFRDALSQAAFDPEPSVALSNEQRAAADAAISALRDESAERRVFLLRGVTGSGKTEVYLTAVEECVALGGQAIVMVPEIALTPQTIQRFAARFPGQVAVLHSGLTDGQRHDQWWAIEEGRYKIAIGSRGAVFAPFSNLSLIVLDEEHEWTYKQHDSQPRYHARDVAIRLGELTGAATILGSASPDVASQYRAHRGEYGFSVLPERLSRGADGATKILPLPSVEVIDMRRELREGNAHIFSRRLSSELEATLDGGRQAILFLNRRGTATNMHCRNCGYSVTCGGCEVALTYHRPLRRLICHYCGRKRRLPDNCPRCLSYRLSMYGIGAQAVAETAMREYPSARVLRWDRDATRYPRDYERTLSMFRDRQADILVGTQMLAKGLHLPGVTLVGAVLADVGLSIPDYRSGERTFQLLCQVAGRAGRGEDAGRAIFQTYQPENYAIRAASAQDYDAFYDAEMRYRREHGNPPHSRLIRLTFSHLNAATAETRAQELASALQTARAQADMSQVEILGPTPPYPSRLRGRYRWHIVLRGRDPRRLLDAITVPQGWVVDVDPVALT